MKQREEGKKERSAIAQLVLHPSSVWTGCQLDPGNICWLIFRNRAEDAEWCRMTKAAFILSVRLRGLAAEPSGCCRCAAALQVSGSTNKMRLTRGSLGIGGTCEYTVVSRAPAEAANELSFGSNVCVTSSLSALGDSAEMSRRPRIQQNGLPLRPFPANFPVSAITNAQEEKKILSTTFWDPDGGRRVLSLASAGLAFAGGEGEVRYPHVFEPTRMPHISKNATLICSPISKWRRGNKSVWCIP